MIDHGDLDPNLLTRQACGLKGSRIHLFSFLDTFRTWQFLCYQKLYPVGDTVGLWWSTRIECKSALANSNNQENVGVSNFVCLTN